MNSLVMLWAGRVLTGLVGAFMLLDGAMKVAKLPFVVEASVKVGIPESAIMPLGAVLCASTLLYLFPRTSVLGAILLTGYLGGAVATNLLTGGGSFPMVFASVFGVLAWLGLWLRDPRLRARTPWQASA